MKQTKLVNNRLNKPGGLLHIDLTRAQARISHAMMLVEDPDELRILSEIESRIDACIQMMFGNAQRPKVGT